MTPSIRRNERSETGGVRRRNRLAAAALRLSLLLAALAISTLALPVTALAAGEHDSHSNNWTEFTAGTPTLSGGSYYLSGDVEYSGTRITVRGEVILCLNGHKLDLNKQHISVGSGASLTLCDCSTGGVLTGGSGINGGGVYVYGGTFTMTGGNITGNTADAGGGVYVYGGTFTMAGGSINNNKATLGGGGGVLVWEGTFTLSGGSITGNATDNAEYGYGGGVCLYGTISFYLSGNPIIQDNTKDNSADNLYLGRQTINITGPLGENAHIGVNAEGVPRRFISGWSDNMAGKNPADYFSSDGDAWDIYLNADGDVVLGSLCTIITQPADKSVIEGKTATFTVNATGSEPLSYQWQQSIDNGNNWTNIASANAAEYTTGKTTMDMNGTQYRCVVENDIGKVTSDAATLTVQKATTPIDPKYVRYIVEHYQQNADGSYTLADAEQPIDEIDKTVTATPKTYEGHTYNPNAAGTVVSGTLKAISSPDDIVTLKLYYDITLYTVTVNGSHAQTTGAGSYAKDATVAIDAGTRSGYTFDGWTSADGVTFANAGSTQTTFTMPANDVTITASWRYDPPYVPPAKTPSEQALEKIGAADDGDTVTVRLPAGDTVLDAEVFEALAGRDVTLVLEMDGNVAWEIMGTDVPAGASYEDVDMGVSLGGDAIPVNVVNLVTGECGGVQVALEHDGPFGFKATLVAPLGEDAAGMYGNLYRYDGDSEALDFEASGMVDEDGTARLTFDHASLWLIALDTRSHALPFADTGEDLWYSEAVRWAWRHGVMTGYADGSESFGTNDSLTRAQMAAVLYNVAGKPDADMSGLPGDCDGGAWYATCVSWALETGVFNGYDDGSSFGPDDPLTREQAACVLMNAASALGADVSARADLSQYPDADEVTVWASDALSWAVAEGVLSGVETGDGARELQPSRACTRAEMAALMMNLSARSAE